MACSRGLLAVFGEVRWQLLAIQIYAVANSDRVCRSHWRGTHSKCKRQLSTATTLGTSAATWLKHLGVPVSQERGLWDELQEFGGDTASAVATGIASAVHTTPGVINSNCQRQSRAKRRG